MQSDRTPLTHRIIRQIALMLPLLFGAHCAAADQDTRWYDVEVIIFSQKSQQFRNSEVWPVDIALPDMANTRTLVSSGRRAFSLLKDRELRLNGEAARIKAAPELDMLLHMGWRQPGLSQDQAISVPIYDGMLSGARYRKPGSTATPHRLEGTLKLVLSRYLHISADLLYREPLADGSVTSTSLPAMEAEPGLDAAAAPHYRVYRMQQSRRMRSRETHYLDHPVLGMVVRVTPHATSK